LNLAILAAAAAALYLYWQGRGPADESEYPTVTDDTPPDTALPDTASEGGILDWSMNWFDNLTTDPADALLNRNVQAFLMMIRTGEGTADAGGYSRLYGGGRFTSFADHPRQAVTANGITSTAAGAYQILARTWDGLGLPDFMPANQDRAAVMLIKRRGALADVIAGRLERAIAKCNREWASLPGAPYGQPTITSNRAAQLFAAYGGSQTA